MSDEETYMQTLSHRLDMLHEDERKRLSPSATFSEQGLRRKKEPRTEYRQNFSLDADRILHSRSYTRYIDKTQVFCLVDNDHITHRVLHVQLVARIARTIARFLFLNEDLTEAIALGHDIGHPPFGHDGEKCLSELCVEFGLPPFQHNIQSVRFLDEVEKKGKGWNLCLQTLDGILCHDGEIHSQKLTAAPLSSFAEFEKKLQAKEKNPQLNLQAATLEGCVVRLADTIAYIGRDIEDAILLKLIKRDDIPSACKEILGTTNGTIVYNLVTDILATSKLPKAGSERSEEPPFVGFSEKTSRALFTLKQFNYDKIYLNPTTKHYLPDIQKCYRALFTCYLSHLKKSGRSFSAKADLMTDMEENYKKNHPPEAMVRDFIAGMTDDFFLKQAAELGCIIPRKQ